MTTVTLETPDGSILPVCALGTAAHRMYELVLKANEGAELGLNSTEVSLLIESYFETQGDGKALIGDQQYFLYDKKCDDDQVILVSPDEFTAYQTQVAQNGMSTMTFRRMVASERKAETTLAILMVVGKHMAWFPKSVIYKYDDRDPSNITFYARESFPITWQLVS